MSTTFGYTRVALFLLQLWIFKVNSGVPLPITLPVPIMNTTTVFPTTVPPVTTTTPLPTSTSTLPPTNDLVRIFKFPIPAFDQHVRGKMKNMVVPPYYIPGHGIGGSMSSSSSLSQSNVANYGSPLSSSQSFAASSSQNAGIGILGFANSMSQAQSSSNSGPWGGHASSQAVAESGANGINGASQAFSSSLSQSIGSGNSHSQAMAAAASNGGGIGGGSSQSFAGSASVSSNLGSMGMAMASSQTFPNPLLFGSHNIRQPIFPGTPLLPPPPSGLGSAASVQSPYASLLAMTNLDGALASALLGSQGGVGQASQAVNGNPY